MTLAPRWHKVLRDIAGTPWRTTLAVLAMAIGVFGPSAILTSYAILGRELATTYAGTHPASATLTLSDAGDATVAIVRHVPGVLDVEARPIIRGRIRVGDDEWMPLMLFVVRNFDDRRIDTFAGGSAPRDDEMLIEQSGTSVAQAGVGDTVVVKTIAGISRPLRISGSVHAAGLAPAWMEHMVYGFVSWTSVMRADVMAETAQVKLVTATAGTAGMVNTDRIAGEARRELETSGTAVSRIDVATPGRHPHADQMNTFLYLLGAFGALTLVLSAVLVATMIHGLLHEQVRHIGSMKTVGATTGQIAGMYLAQVALLAAISLCVSIPLGTVAGQGYADFAATILNATISTHAVPPWVLVVELAIGIGVPLLVALGPVLRASRLTIHQAFSNDVGRRPFGVSRFDRWLAGIAWLPRPLMLSLRTTIHMRGRLALTIGTLAAGGVVFVAALSTSASWSHAIAKDAESRPYDIEVRLSRPYPVATLARAVGAISEVNRAEYWPDASGVLEQPDSASATDRPAIPALHGDVISGDRVAMIAPDADTQFLKLKMLEGRWLEHDDRTNAVISSAMQSADPTLHVGGNITIRVERAQGAAGRVVSWRIAGVARELFPAAVIYVRADALAPGNVMARTIRVRSSDREDAAQVVTSQALDRELARQGITVANIQRLIDRRQSFEDHLVIIKSALLFAAALVVLVGGLGLTSTLTLSVIERTREIGVMGAIGATPRTIARQIVIEGVVIGVASFLLAIAVAVPITLGLCSVTGRMFVRTPIDFVMPLAAPATWLALVVLLAVVSSAYPARRAARLTVREALAHA